MATERLNDIKTKITFTNACFSNFLLFYLNFFSLPVATQMKFPKLKFKKLKIKI